MQLARLDPTTLFRDFDRLIETSFRPTPAAGWMPRVDVFDRDESLVIRAELPGVDPESVDVTVENGALIISGSRSFTSEDSDGDYRRREIFQGDFRRSLLLPEGLDLDSITATGKDGVVEISIPRSPEVLPKKIKVELAG